MNITTITNLNDNHVRQLISLYKNEFWCNKRELNDVIRMLQNTDIVVGAVTDSDELIGFVRVLTNFVYKATILDLIVHSDWRNKKIGKLLMDKVVYHPKLVNIEHFDLNCLPEMYPFYEKWNFAKELDTLGFMRRISRQ
jgi:GNAT superfamily N-acetyltransferase